VIIYFIYIDPHTISFIKNIFNRITNNKYKNSNNYIEINNVDSELADQDTNNIIEINTVEPESTDSNTDTNNNCSNTDTNNNYLDSIKNRIVKPFRKKKRKKEVFNINENIFTYNQAKQVCKSYNSKLATYDQLLQAYKNGGNWCNYGWSDNQMALYPIQKSFYNKIQNTNHKNTCGKPGINGGIFEDPNIKFGVNCYGYKPKADKEKLSCKKPTKIKINKNNLTIRPFNHIKWSKKSKEKCTHIIDDMYNIQQSNLDKEPININSNIISSSCKNVI
tara:strand:- start:753 stop:1583 length:831 start_codon:yes stop_codon:yes gene_type:complete